MTYDVDGRLVRFVDLGLVEDDQNTGALVQNAAELLVQDHLRQLVLHLVLRQIDLLRDVLDLFVGEEFRLVSSGFNGQWKLSKPNKDQSCNSDCHRLPSIAYLNGREWLDDSA